MKLEIPPKQKQVPIKFGDLPIGATFSWSANKLPKNGHVGVYIKVDNDRYLILNSVTGVEDACGRIEKEEFCAPCYQVNQFFITEAGA
jgi:hypothetical protein